MSKKDNKTTVNITNNFNAPVGQQIDHVDNLYFQMDGEGNFHFGQVEQESLVTGAKITPQRLGQAVKAVQQLMWGKSAYAVQSYEGFGVTPKKKDKEKLIVATFPQNTTFSTESDSALPYAPGCHSM